VTRAFISFGPSNTDMARIGRAARHLRGGRA
jgi:hypothetical protein